VREVKGNAGRGGGLRSFIDVESGTRAVRAPCPTRRSLNQAGQTPRLRLHLQKVTVGMHHISTCTSITIVYVCGVDVIVDV
jgi:hypothetical protein